VLHVLVAVTVATAYLNETVGRFVSFDLRLSPSHSRENGEGGSMHPFALRRPLFRRMTENSDSDGGIGLTTVG